MSKRFEKSIEINASPDKVWKILTDNTLATAWCSASMPGAYVEGDWREGGTVYYKDTEGHGLRGQVAEMRPQEYLRIDMQMELLDGKDDPANTLNPEWQQSHDAYMLQGHDGHTHLSVEIVCPDVHYDDFFTMWDTNLETLKKLAETL